LAQAKHFIFLIFSGTKRASGGPILQAMKQPLLLCSALLPLLVGCVSVKTEPIEVKPIHITVDVNVKVERALDDFFGDLDKKSATFAHSETK
jgi:hypothetical protein